MSKLITKGGTGKRHTYEVFRSELDKSLPFVDMVELANKTEITYIKTWRLIRGYYDWKADDFFKIVVALGREDIIKKIISSVKTELNQTRDRGKGKRHA